MGRPWDRTSAVRSSNAAPRARRTQRIPAAAALCAVRRPFPCSRRGDGQGPRKAPATREQLEPVIRAVADITGRQRLVAIGSQAILGRFPHTPAELLVSREADIYAPDHPELSELITGSIGQGGRFEATHAYVPTECALSPQPSRRDGRLVSRPSATQPDGASWFTTSPSRGT